MAVKKVQTTTNKNDGKEQEKIRKEIESVTKKTAKLISEVQQITQTLDDLQKRTTKLK